MFLFFFRNEIVTFISSFFFYFAYSFSLSLSFSPFFFIYSDRAMWSSIVTEMNSILLLPYGNAYRKKNDFLMHRNRDYVSVSMAIFNKRNASEMMIVIHFSFSCLPELSLSVTYNLWIKLKDCDFVFTVPIGSQKSMCNFVQMQYGNHYK